MTDDNRIMPSLPDVERAILGSILLRNSVLTQVKALINPEDFFHLNHRISYQAMLTTAEANEGAVDLVALKDYLKMTNQLDTVGGIAYLSGLLDAVPTSANIVQHCHLLISASLRRLSIQMAEKINLEAYDGELEEVAALMTKSAATIAERQSRGTTRQPKDIVGEIFARLQACEEGKIIPGSISTGIEVYDSLIGLLAPGDLVVIGARPGDGKSAAGAQIAQFVSQDKDAIFISAEMTAESLITRMLATGLNTVKGLRNGKVYDWSELSRAIRDVSGLKLWIDDRARTCPAIIKAIAERVQQHTGNLGLIVVDYIQRIHADASAVRRNMQRYEEVGTVTRTLKEIAKSLMVPVLALSQVGRQGDYNRSKSPPGLADLRESGDIENDADIVTLIWHPAKAKLERDDDGYSTEGMAKLLTLKHRHGECGVVNVTFDGAHTRFTPFVQRYQEGINTDSGSKYDPDDDWQL